MKGGGIRKKRKTKRKRKKKRKKRKKKKKKRKKKEYFLSLHRVIKKTPHFFPFYCPFSFFFVSFFFFLSVSLFIRAIITEQTPFFFSNPFSDKKKRQKTLYSFLVTYLRFLNKCSEDAFSASFLNKQNKQTRRELGTKIVFQFTKRLNKKK